MGVALRALLVVPLCATGCGPSYRAVGSASLVTALPVALTVVAAVLALETLWAITPSKRTALLKLGAAVGGLATVGGLVLLRGGGVLRGDDALPVASSLRLLYLGLLVTNTLPIALSLLAWRLVVSRSEAVARVVAVAAVPGGYWLLAATAACVWRQRRVDDTLGSIVLWGGSLGLVPLVVFAVLVLEGGLRRRARAITAARRPPSARSGP